MLMPISSGWICCETCDHWEGERKLSPLGLLARSTSAGCSAEESPDPVKGSPCPAYRKWRQLEAA